MLGLHRQAKKSLHFNAGQDKRSDAFEVVVNDRLAQVIIIRTIAAIAEAGDRATLAQGNLSGAVGLDELRDDAVITFENGGNVIARQVPVVDGLR